MDTLRISEAEKVVAPDGSTVIPLLSVEHGSAAHCTLPPGGVSRAVRHRVVEEIWFFISGRGEMWRREPRSGKESIELCAAGVCVTIPEGVEFQFRNTGDDPLVFLCMTMPPWPGEHVASVVVGKWRPLL